MPSRLSAAALLPLVLLHACDRSFQPMAGLWVVRYVAPVADTCGVGLDVEPPEVLSIVRDQSRIRVRRADGLYVDCDRISPGAQRYRCDELDVHVRIDELDVVVREQVQLFVAFDEFAEGRFLLQAGLSCRAGPCEEEEEALREEFGGPVPCGVSWEGELTFDYERPDPDDVR